MIAVVVSSDRSNLNNLQLKRVQPGTKLQGWKEISDRTMTHVTVKDEEADGNHISKVYRFPPFTSYSSFIRISQIDQNLPGSFIFFDL